MRSNWIVQVYIHENVLQSSQRKMLTTKKRSYVVFSLVHVFFYNYSSNLCQLLKSKFALYCTSSSSLLRGYPESLKMVVLNQREGWEAVSLQLVN